MSASSVSWYSTSINSTLTVGFSVVFVGCIFATFLVFLFQRLFRTRGGNLKLQRSPNKPRCDTRSVHLHGSGDVRRCLIESTRTIEQYDVGKSNNVEFFLKVLPSSSLHDQPISAAVVDYCTTCSCSGSRRQSLQNGLSRHDNDYDTPMTYYFWRPAPRDQTSAQLLRCSRTTSSQVCSCRLTSYPPTCFCDTSIIV